jgi:threonine/homoserine/homoserine lactone efflux protein
MITAQTLILFVLTIGPLILTPGPDILLVVAQAMTRGRRHAANALGGILTGYAAHAVLAMFGVAAIVAATPALFEAMRWAGVAYLGWLAIRMLVSAARAADPAIPVAHGTHLFWHGFLTSFLNPKGLLMFFAVLPQFITPEGQVAMQALVLSAIFIAGCAVAYGTILMLAARAASMGGFADGKRRVLEACAGCLLGWAALKLASASR